MIQIRRFFRPAQAIPPEHRNNFLHWYLDIIWFGVLNGSTLVFLSVFCARQGASVEQLGLLTATPALMNLIFTFPAASIIRRMPSWKATCWSALLTRVFYLLFAPLPLLLNAGGQVWVIILLCLVMNLPGTVMAVVGNAFFAETVPSEYRGQVVGIRMALLSVATMLTSLVVGQVLNRMVFPHGYIVVFSIGFLGAAMSTYHLFRIRPLSAAPAPVSVYRPETSQDRKNILDWLPREQMRVDVLKGPFGLVLLLMFGFQLAMMAAGPIFPLYQVDQLKFSDQEISLGASIFWIFHFIGSTQAVWLSRRWGFKKLTSIGVLLTALATGIFIFSYSFWLFALVQFISGIGWSWIGSGQINYLLERVPVDDRPAYLTWYNVAMNLALLLASLLAPLIASWLGLEAALITIVSLRILVGLLILRRG